MGRTSVRCMGRDAVADREAITASLKAIEAAYDQLEQCSFDALSSEELVAVLARREVLAWRAPVVEHQILARLVTDGDAGELGACSLTKALAERLRISVAAARRRLAEAAELGPRTALSGEPLEPVLPALAAAQAKGRVGPEQVAIARKAYAKIPAAVPAAERERAEADLALLAGGFGPETFQRLADHLLAVLDPDGDFRERERLARRGLCLGRQGADGMSSLKGKISPELRATLSRSWPNSPPPACAMGPMSTPASAAPPAKNKSEEITAPRPNATTMPSWLPPARCSPPAISGNSTGCRSPSSSPPP